MDQTELAVINALLRVIGESPVNIVDMGHPDIVMALDTWEEYSSEIQTIGWWFNTEVWQLQAQTDGTVVLPSNTLTVDGSNQEYIKKGRFLYDKENHTYNLGAASQADLNLTLITKWDIDELPPTVFNYILARAKLKFLVDLAFDANKAKNLEEEINTRYHLVQKQQLRFGKPNRKNVQTAQQLLNAQPTR